MNKRIELKDHVSGALYGFAIGDYEGSGDCLCRTRMMLAVSEAFMLFPDDSEKFKVECANIFSTLLSSLKADMDDECRECIEFYDRTGEFSSQAKEKSNCWSLTRYLPCALVHKDSFNLKQSRVTHGSPECDRSILKASEALRQSMIGNYTFDDHMGLQEASDDATGVLHNSLVYASSGSFKHALKQALADEGDSTSIAAIACSFAGARVGLSEIDPRLVSKIPIEVKKSIGKFSDFVVSYLTNKELV